MWTNLPPLPLLSPSNLISLLVAMVSCGSFPQSQQVCEPALALESIITTFDMYIEKVVLQS